METENTTRESGHGCTDPVDQLIAKTAAALSGRLESREFDFSAIAEWDAIEPGFYLIGETDADAIAAELHSDRAHLRLDSEHLPEGRLQVSYSEGGVALEQIANNEPHRFSALTEFTPEQAREVAYSLLIAAEEFERRPKEEPVDGGTQES